MPKRKKVDITDRYIRVRMRQASEFVPNTFYTINVNVEEGVKAIVGKLLEEDKNVAQAYIFDKDKWDVDSAKEWAENYVSAGKKSYAEKLINNRLMVTANLTLCSKNPDLKIGTQDVKPLKEENMTLASVNDKYYFYAEPVHEGPNLNDDFFSQDELVKSYNSMAHTPLDWEHIRSQIVGFTLNSELISEPEAPVKIGINGVINRLSPWVTTEDEDGLSRDETIRKRWFEGKLKLSMEALFDAIECSKCGQVYDDYLEFEHHKYTSHYNDDVYRKLLGVSFIGNGIVKTPADPDADVISLRTSNDGDLAIEVIEASRKEHGPLAENIVFSNLLINMEPDIELNDGKFVVFAKKSDKNAKKDEIINKNSTKKSGKNDKDNEQELTNSNNALGGIMKFNLAEKTSKAKNLSDVFVVAQTILKDYQGDNNLTAEDVEAFNTELSEVIASFVDDKFRVTEIYTLTNQDKLDAVSTAREEEKNSAQVKIDELTASWEAEKATVTKITEEKESAEAKVTELEQTIADAAVTDKVDDFVSNMKSAGISLTDSMEKTIKDMAKAALVSSEDEGKAQEALNSIHNSFVSIIKQSNLSNASHVMDGGSGGTADEPKSFQDELKTIREKHLKEDNK